MEVKKLYYSMGEVTEMFDVNASLIRFWESKFDVLRPAKNKKGNRMFTPEDVGNLKLIYHLVKERGMTLEGAARCMKHNRKELVRESELLERLQRVRALLVQVREELKADGDEKLVADAAAEVEPAERQPEGVKRGAVVVCEPARSDRPAPEQKEKLPFYEQTLFDI